MNKIANALNRTFGYIRPANYILPEDFDIRSELNVNKEAAVYARVAEVFNKNKLKLTLYFLVAGLLTTPLGALGIWFKLRYDAKKDVSRALNKKRDEVLRSKNLNNPEFEKYFKKKHKEMFEYAVKHMQGTATWSETKAKYNASITGQIKNFHNEIKGILKTAKKVLGNEYNERMNEVFKKHLGVELDLSQLSIPVLADKFSNIKQDIRNEINSTEHQIAYIRAHINEAKKDEDNTWKPGGHKNKKAIEQFRSNVMFKEYKSAKKPPVDAIGEEYIPVTAATATVAFGEGKDAIHLPIYPGLIRDMIGGLPGYTVKINGREPLKQPPIKANTAAIRAVGERDKKLYSDLKDASFVSCFETKNVKEALAGIISLYQTIIASHLSMSAENKQHLWMILQSFPTQKYSSPIRNLISLSSSDNPKDNDSALVGHLSSEGEMLEFSIELVDNNKLIIKNIYIQSYYSQFDSAAINFNKESPMRVPLGLQSTVESTFELTLHDKKPLEVAFRLGDVALKEIPVPSQDDISRSNSQESIGGDESGSGRISPSLQGSLSRSASNDSLASSPYSASPLFEEFGEGKGTLGFKAALPRSKSMSDVRAEDEEYDLPIPRTKSFNAFLSDAISSEKSVNESW